MRQPIHILALLGGLMLAVTQTKAASESSLSLGVHLHGADGKVAADLVETRNYFNRDFTVRAFEFPIVQREGKGLAFTVHYPDFEPGALRVEARPITSASASHPVPVEVTSLGDDRYRVEAKQPVADDRVVLVGLGCCVAGVYGAVLTEPKPVFMQAYAKGTEHNPVTAEQAVARLTDARPDDADFARLEAYWEKRVAQEEASEHFAFVEKVWSQYQNTEGLEARIDKLKHVRSVCQRYLEKHPQGRERDEVKAMLEKVETKLDV